jgi:hypothetical protein
MLHEWSLSSSKLEFEFNERANASTRAGSVVGVEEAVVLLESVLT